MKSPPVDTPEDKLGRPSHQETGSVLAVVDARARDAGGGTSTARSKKQTSASEGI